MNDSTFIACRGCGLRLPDQNIDQAERFNASGECLKMYFELACWTLVQQDVRFIHQHAVDAYEAQHAGGRTRPITVVFGLIGLYLALEKGYTGPGATGPRENWKNQKGLAPARTARTPCGTDGDGRSEGGDGCGERGDAFAVGGVSLAELSTGTTG